MLTLIGDADQLLFRFAGSKPELVTDEAPKYFPGMLTFKMETNYRSTMTIVAEQRKSIAHNYRSGGGPYNNDLFKYSKARNGAKIGEPISFEMFEHQEQEADYVARTILQLCDEGYAWGDVFVGARTRSQLGFIEGALTKRGIKFVNLGGGCFWSSKHVSDVLAYVQLALDEQNGEAFKRVYNIASRWWTAPFGSNKGEYINHRFLGRSFFEYVNGCYTNIEKVYADRRNAWRYESAVSDLIFFVESVRSQLRSGGVAAAIKFVIENCYKQYLAADEGLLSLDESENGKLDDLVTVVTIAEKYSDPVAFFEYVEAMRAAAQDIKRGDHHKYVIISTVHKLKGKERPIVFGIGVCEGVDKNGDPLGLLPHTFSLKPPPQFGVLPTGGMSNIPDERCVFFVLISRAKERVYLSGFRNFREGELHPSRFVKEIGLVKENHDLE